MRRGEQGTVVEVLIVLIVVALIGIVLLALFVIKIEFGDQNVSGIAYNVKNNEWPVGNTSFSIRAAVDTVVTEENQSSYCLPAGSPYIDLVNKAAENKEIKLVVKTERGLWFKAPWTCIDNVTVKEKK